MSAQQPPDPAPDRRRGVPAATVGAGVAGVLLAVLGCAMIVRGLPQQTTGQRWLLDLSSLPLSLAVALVVARVVLDRGMLRRAEGAPLPRLFLAGAGLVVLGLVLWVPVLAGVRAPVVNPVGAQTVLWLGLGCWCVWVLRDRPRRPPTSPADAALRWRVEPDDD